MVWLCLFCKISRGGGKPPLARGSDTYAREHLVLTKGQPSVSSVFESTDQGTDRVWSEYSIHGLTTTVYREARY